MRRHRHHHPARGQAGNDATNSTAIAIVLAVILLAVLIAWLARRAPEDAAPPRERPKEIEVEGYIRKDGTYVAPHKRSRPR